MNTQAIILWTRQADGSYTKEGISQHLKPSNLAIDEDYKTNPHTVCPGLKLRSRIMVQIPRGALSCSFE